MLFTSGNVLLHRESKKFSLQAPKKLHRFVTTISFPSSLEGKSSKRPLDGIRVVECGHLIAGPFAGTILSYFGADVIKIEPPGGDQVRKWREMNGDTSLWWYSIGRNKKSVALDMKSESGRSIVRDLIAKSDVLIENFRPGTMEKWNLGPLDFEKDNPGLVYARVSGYGQDGPYASRPGFASVCEAMGGFRYVNGFPDRPPVRQNLSMGDTIAGIHAALGIVIALLGRERNIVTTENGQKAGQVVDVAIYECLYNLMEAVVPEYDFSGIVRECSGSTVTGIVPSNTYLTSDGKNVVVAANTDTLFVKLMNVIEREDMAHNSAYKTNSDRVQHQKIIDDAISNWVASHPLEYVEKTMASNNIPVGLVYSVEDMIQDPQYQFRKMFEEVSLPKDTVGKDSLRIPAIVPKLNGTPGRTDWGGRRVGEDTRSVLNTYLRMSDADIQQLFDNNVVFES